MELEDNQALHHGVARALGIEIIDGVWPVQVPRTLEEIQTRFGVSRTVAREAVRQLESLGLLQARRRLGLAPQPLSEWSVLDLRLIGWRLNSTQRDAQIRSLTHLRLAVEPAAADAAARVDSVHTRAQLLPVAAEMRRAAEAGELLEFLERDIEFHRLLLKSCGNELFAALHELVAVVLKGRTGLGLMPPVPRPEAIDDHEAVAEAVFRGDPAAARAAMTRILERVYKVIAEES